MPRSPHAPQRVAPHSAAPPPAEPRRGLRSALPSPHPTTLPGPQRRPLTCAARAPGSRLGSNARPPGARGRLRRAGRGGAGRGSSRPATPGPPEGAGAGAEQLGPAGQGAARLQLRGRKGGRATAVGDTWDAQRPGGCGGAGPAVPLPPGRSGKELRGRELDAAELQEGEASPFFAEHRNRDPRGENGWAKGTGELVQNWKDSKGLCDHSTLPHPQAHTHTHTVLIMALGYK